MPTKIEEYSLYSPGSLVVSAKELFSAHHFDGDNDADKTIPEGTVGLIVEGPNPERRRQYYVRFLRDMAWWVNDGEILPYLR